MDGQASSSDSDSSETWTVIDRSDIPQSYAVPESEINCETCINPEKLHHEDDTDTDGSIAVITDDETDVTTTTPNILITNESDLSDGTLPSDPMQSSYLFSNSSNTKCKDDDMETNSTCTLRESEQELSDEFFLSDFKIKSYVHRKNDRISSLLNAILVSTVMVTTVLAIGHMWGTTDDCSLNAINSVSRILFNMQKLQQENDMLKSKIMLLQSIPNQRPTAVDPAVFLDRENPFKSVDKRADNFYQNSIKRARKDVPNDLESVKFDQNFVTTYPSINSFNINNRLHSTAENQTLEEPVAVPKSVLESDVRDDNVKNSKFSKRYNKYDKIECSQASMDVGISSIGPKTYCESKIIKKRLQKALPHSNNSNKENKPKKEKGVKAILENAKLEKQPKQDKETKDKPLKKSEKKMKKKLSKDTKSKKDYPEIGNNSEKIKRDYLKLADVNSDWYYKMSNAREEFRKWNQYDKTYNRKRKDKPNWYLRRMRDREAIRFNADV